MRAIDNINVDAFSAAAMSSSHGTAASLHQKVRQKDAGVQTNIKTKFSNNKKLKKLPDSYTDVLAAYLPPPQKRQKLQKYHQNNINRKWNGG